MCVCVCVCVCVWGGGEEGMGINILPPTRNIRLCIKVGSCVRHFNVSLITWAKSQDSVPKPQFLKTKES